MPLNVNSNVPSLLKQLTPFRVQATAYTMFTVPSGDDKALILSPGSLVVVNRQTIAHTVWMFQRQTGYPDLVIAGPVTIPAYSGTGPHPTAELFPLGRKIPNGCTVLCQCTTQPAANTGAYITGMYNEINY